MGIPLRRRRNARRLRMSMDGGGNARQEARAQLEPGAIPEVGAQFPGNPAALAVKRTSELETGACCLGGE